MGDFDKINWSTVPNKDFLDPQTITPKQIQWLIDQLAQWPTRVDPNKTTNISFLMTTADCLFGKFMVSGTICGSVDIVVPQFDSTLTLTIPELDDLIRTLSEARKDVVENSRPYSDHRIRGDK